MLSILLEAAHVETQEDVFPAFDPQWVVSQIFWLFILFGFLYLVLSRMVLPKMSDTVEKRGNRIASDLDDAAKLNDQATEAQQALELRMAEAKANARETADAARAKIEAEIANESARVDAELETKMQEAEARVSDLRKKAMTNVEGIATEAAGSILERFGLKSSAADITSAVSATRKG